MSPIEYISEGIRQGNWEIVCEGYERLTGVALPLPTTHAITNKYEDVLHKILDIVSNAISKPIVELEKIPKKKKYNRLNKSPKKKTTRAIDEEDDSLKLDDRKKTIVQKEIGGTRLITNEPDPKEIKKNIARAKRTNSNKLMINRKVPIKHLVNCNECEKTFKSDRPKGEMGQKCDQCLKEKRGRFA